MWMPHIFLQHQSANENQHHDNNQDYLYLTSQEYEPEKEFGVKWNDPDLRIPWQNQNPILSEKDKANKSVRESFY